MTKDEARIVLLEDQLIHSHYLITFLHGCLTSDKFKYAYPEQTLQHLEKIESLLKVPHGCYHSRFTANCDVCVEVHERHMKILEAKRVLEL